MKTGGHRKNIIRNTLWGNVNIGIRYLSSFIATAIIARHYSPENFGFYQLILTYLGMLEVINLLHATHMRNHLMEYPEDENLISGIWFYQSIGIWIFTSLGIVAITLLSKDQTFWWLLLLANTRFLFRAFDYVYVVADYRLRSDIVQKIQIFNMGSFNLVRIVFSYFSLPLSVLISSSFFQGLFSTCYQLYAQRKIGFNLKKQFSWSKYLELIKGGGYLTCVFILSTFQIRIVSALAAQKMSAISYGNLQLILKLIEPATAIGLIIMTANYTILTHTLKSDKSVFYVRFYKVALLSLLASAAVGVIIIVFPSSLLIRVFGENYVEAINYLWLGACLIMSSSLLAISTQLDTILRNYKTVMLKYLIIFLIYVFYFMYVKDIGIRESILLQLIVPIFVVGIIDFWRYLTGKNNIKKE